ncbi:MAG: TetR/AcrR family transcriptional regulator [Spirochaetales bacterium]|nr:TetR/AcrR family transcriptional regulator [Spirochaetales bacterium]
MPKGFSEREKEIIRKRLFEEGSRLFDQFGIQKTTVDDIAAAAGISKGSFYSFFHSKEELFFDILEDIERTVKGKFFGQVFQGNTSHRESFRAFINNFFTMMECTPLFKQINPTNMEYLMRKLPGERIENHMKKDYSVFEEFYHSWCRKGILRKLDIKGFTGVMKLLFYLVVHQQDYTPDEYKATKDTFIDMLCKYLVIERSKK